MPAPVPSGKPGVIEMTYKPPRDWREVARNARGRLLDSGHFPREVALDGVLRDLRRFLDHV